MEYLLGKEIKTSDRIEICDADKIRKVVAKVTGKKAEILNIFLNNCFDGFFTSKERSPRRGAILNSVTPTALCTYIKDGRWEYWIIKSRSWHWKESKEKVLSGNTKHSKENTIRPAHKYKIVLRYDMISERFQLQAWDHKVALNHNTHHYYKTAKWCGRIIFNLKNNTTLVRYKTKSKGYVTRYISLKNYHYIMSRVAIDGARQLVCELLDYYADGTVFSKILNLGFNDKLPISNTLLKNSKDMKTALKKINGDELEIPKKLLSLCNKDLAFIITSIVKPKELNKVTQYMANQEEKIKTFVDQTSQIMSTKEMDLYEILGRATLFDRDKNRYRNTPELKREACDNMIYNSSSRGISINTSFFFRMYCSFIGEEVPRSTCEDYIKMAFDLGEKINLRIKSINRLIHEHDLMSVKYGIKQVGNIEPKKWYRELSSTDKYSIHLIDVGEDLVTEGMKMKHCVASYSSQINRGDSAIFHIEMKDQQHLVKICKDDYSRHKLGWTLEAGISEDPDNEGKHVLYNKQFRGFANCQPPKEVMDDIEKLLSSTRVKILKKELKNMHILTNDRGVRPVAVAQEIMLDDAFFADLDDEDLPF